MEEKLLALMQKQQLLERENESLKQQALQETSELNVEVLLAMKWCVYWMDSEIEEKEEEEEETNKLEKLEQLIKTLRYVMLVSACERFTQHYVCRQQLAQSNREGEQCQNTIQGLREEIEEKHHAEGNHISQL